MSYMASLQLTILVTLCFDFTSFMTFTEVTPLIIMQTFLMFASMLSSGTVNSIVAIIHLFILQSYTFSSMSARKANKSAIHVVMIFKCS